MNYLLDTHTLVWALLDTGLLSEKVKSIIQGTENSIFVSVVSFWEFSLKSSVGKLKSVNISPEDLPGLVVRNQFSILAIAPEEASSGYRLHTHKDPFYRMLIWQALRNDLTIFQKILILVCTFISD